MVIVCTRTSGETGPHADLADRLEAVPLARVERLAPLTPDGIRSLAHAEGFRDASGSFLRALGAESGGVPFLVKALLASARGAGLDGQCDPERLAGLGAEPV